MINAAGFFDWAEIDLGPSWKVNGGVNGGKGMVPHSAEGYWPPLRVELHKPTRRASWGASNLKNGRFIQHYSVFSQTWTSGAGYPNNNFFAFENEGVAGEPLTPQQTANIIRVGRDLIAHYGWTPRRPFNAGDKGASLYEHTECVRWGAEPTACPSGRIPWDVIVPALKEEDEPMTPEEKIEFEKLRQTVGKLAVEQHNNNVQQALYLLRLDEQFKTHEQHPPKGDT